MQGDMKWTRFCFWRHVKVDVQPNSVTSCMTLDKLFLTLSFLLCKTRRTMTTSPNFCEDRELCTWYALHVISTQCVGNYYYEAC